MTLRPARSRAGSLVEAGTNVVAGYVLALVTQWLVYPQTTLSTDAVIAFLFTAVSLARSYLLRCLFESLAWRHHRARA